MTTSGRGTVVVGVDGSTGSVHALRWAVEEARLRDAAVEVVHVWDAPPPVAHEGTIYELTDPSVFEHAAKELLYEVTRAAGVADEGAPPIATTAVRGQPARTLLDRPGDLLVVGSRGLGGIKALVLGSVSQQCATHASMPVVVVPEGAVLPDHIHDVLVGVDGSPGSLAALDLAVIEAHRRHVRLVALHAWWSPMLAAGHGVAVAQSPSLTAASRQMLAHLVDGALSRTGVAPDVELVVPNRTAAVPALLDRGRTSGLLVVGSRGRGGFAGLLLGSVSQQCLHGDPTCAVVVVPSRREAEAR